MCVGGGRGGEEQRTSEARSFGHDLQDLAPPTPWPVSTVIEKTSINNCLAPLINLLNNGCCYIT